MSHIDSPISPPPSSSDSSSITAPSHPHAHHPSSHHDPVAPDMDARARRIRKRYRTAFQETGLEGESLPENTYQRMTRSRRPSARVRWRSQLDIHEVESREDVCTEANEPSTLLIVNRPLSGASALLVSRLTFLAAVIAIMIPLFHLSPWLHAGIPIGAEASPIVDRSEIQHARISARQSDSADVCLRWAHQSALVNGTLYLYGGRSIADSKQKSNTWNNNLLTLDLKKSWQISSPALKALPKADGPPPVALGFLWNSQDTLYLYGGQYSDTPEVTPDPYSMWSYNIPSSKWEESANPETIDGDSVQRSAEGSGVNIPHLGRGLYFGGHLDRFTTPEWDISVWRVYLRSLLEFTFPGVPTAKSINSGKPAGKEGVFRNITEGGIQESAGFTERADGLLIYVPGYAKEGILVGLAGGTNESFTQMNVIDVYDIADEKWYKQSTSGPTPKPRVNPCSVATSAPDGSSVQVHMFGGQKLLPAGTQEQYDDLWILSIPSFTWIEVDMKGQSVPPGRSGHTCDIWNGQMVMVGGYVGPDFSCESPGIYVFNTSSLKWGESYAALEGSNDVNQQVAQQDDSAALQGSYGYRVPKVVQEAIGGNELGAATITAPAQTVTAGPFASGKPVTYTVTRPDGSVATETGTSSGSTSSQPPGPNIAAIVAGVIAGLFAILAIYLGFCTWVYRRQLALYKNHVSMTQRQGGPIGPPAILGLGRSNLDSSTGKNSMDATSASSSTRGNVEGYQPVPMGHGYHHSLTGGGGVPDLGDRGSANGGFATARSSTEDLLAGLEPSFLGVLLSPRRSLRVINRD